MLRVDSIRAIERRALAETAPGTLMARAADALADACAIELRRLPARTPVLALVGPGNNGGDALLAALRLAERGWAVRAIALSAAPPTAADARRARQTWEGSGRSLDDPAAAPGELAAAPLVIDGLFGIGLARPLPPAAAALAHAIGSAGSTVVAVDVPSGLDADRGAVVGDAAGTVLRAAVTVTMIADKPGLHTGIGPACAGRVVVADLGLGPERDATGGTLYDGEDIDRLLPPRPADAHKGRYGDVLVIAGHPAMRGATTLAVLGAQAAGAGRLYVGLDDDRPADPLHPEVMSRRIAVDDPDPLRALGPASVIVIGCGLGAGPQARARMLAALAHPAALVLDADGLNAVAADPTLQTRLTSRGGVGAPTGRTVLTPHPLEAARLLGTTTAAVQADRIGAALELARRFHATVVLKGAGSIVSDEGGRWSVNASGGPILSVAGTGDVLAGTVGGLLAVGLASGDAARLGAWLHGAAGDRLAARSGWARSTGLPASRLAEAIRATLNRPGGRS